MKRADCEAALFTELCLSEKSNAVITKHSGAFTEFQQKEKKKNYLSGTEGMPTIKGRRWVWAIR
jgi:hypothetical protein